MSYQTLQTLYESDFQVWLEKTIDCLEKKQLNRLDIQHLIEELKDLGRSDRKALESNLMILMAHLLKLKIQNDVPEQMKGSWYDSIVENRQRQGTHRGIFGKQGFKGGLQMIFTIVGNEYEF